MPNQAAPLLLLLLAALAAPTHGWDMSMTSLADKLGGAIEVKGIQQGSIQSKLPLVLNVWPFVNATASGWAALNNASSPTPWLDAVEKVRAQAAANRCGPPLPTPGCRCCFCCWQSMLRSRPDADTRRSLLVACRDAYMQRCKLAALPCRWATTARTSPPSAAGAWATAATLMNPGM